MSSIVSSLPSRVGVIHQHLHTVGYEVIQLEVLLAAVTLFLVKQLKEVAAGTGEHSTVGREVLGANLRRRVGDNEIIVRSDKETMRRWY